MPPLLDNKNPSVKSVFAALGTLARSATPKGACDCKRPPSLHLGPGRRYCSSFEGDRSGASCQRLALLSHRTLYVRNRRKGGRHRRVGGRRSICRSYSGGAFRERLSLADQHDLGWSNHPNRQASIFVAIYRALRDEGTSYHYALPSEYSEADPELIATAARALKADGVNVITGACWTTDAPFRETEEAIAAARSKGILAVEMEAAALYAFARARDRKVLCLAHVTNTMAVADQDFEKGEADGTIDALRVIEAIISELVGASAVNPGQT